MKTKAMTYFSEYPAAELPVVARAVHASLTKNAAVFGLLPMSLDDLDTLIRDYSAKLQAKMGGGGKPATLALKDAKLALALALRSLGNHVNGVAKHDPVVVEQSGFPSYQTLRRRHAGPPLEPLDLRLKHGVLPGTILARYRPRRANSANEVQVTESDPQDETAWRQVGFFARGRAELRGLTPGALIWVRVRTLGPKNTWSNWSDPAQIRVL